MGTNLRLLPALFTFLTVISSPGGPRNLPDGYGQGRGDAKYGSYSSTVQASARVLQERAESLEKKAYGLSLLTEETPVAQAQAGLELEFELVRLALIIGAAPDAQVSAFEREALLFQVAHAYGIARSQAERLYENMIRYVDVKLPGPNGLQIRTEPANANPLYYPNYRSDEVLTEAQQKERYEQKRKAFLAEGGKLEEISALDDSLVASLGRYARLEYIEDKGGVLRVTAGRAGHLLLAEGGPVRVAGQLVILKDGAGKVMALILSNASGTYKPDLWSAEQLANRLAARFQLPRGLAIVTKGEPLSPQTIKVYLKADGTKVDEINRQVDDLEAFGRRILSRPAGSIVACSSAFGD